MACSSPVVRGLAVVGACVCAWAGAGLAGAQTPATAPALRTFTLDDYSNERDVSDVAVSPDGAWVAYAVGTADDKDDTKSSDLWMVSWDGKQQLSLTHTPKENESDPHWSPDGRFLGFLADRGNEDGSSQVWVLGRSGGEAQKLTEVEGSVSDFAWSPDSKRLALIVEDPDPDAAEAKETGAGAKKTTPHPIVINRYTVSDGYAGNRRSHLYVFDVATRTAQLLTPGSTDEIFPAWSPDGRQIAFASKRGGDPDRHWNWDVYVIDAQEGAVPRALTNFEGEDASPSFGSPPVWSPDGRSIAYLRAVDASWQQHFYGGPVLAVVPAAGGEPRLLTQSLDRHVSQPRWSRKGGRIYFLIEDDRKVVLARVPAAGGAVERLTSGRRVIQDFDLGPDGRVAVSSGSSDRPYEVFALEGGSLRALTQQNQALLAGVELGKVEELDVVSKDGTPIGAMLVKPPGFRAGQRYPTLLLIHGGPSGQDQNEFDSSAQWFAARGYVVVQPNYRGSSGRGFRFSSAIARDWGHLEVQDVLAAVDALVAKGIADPDRLVIGGWSYGAMTTNYAIASDPRFKAAVSGAGIANQITGYGTDEYLLQYENELGPPWQSLDAYLKVSYPFFHADRIQTPTLFLCGESDSNVPVVNSEQMYQALRSLGRDTELVIYPGEGHSFSAPSNDRDSLQRWVDWYDAHLKPAAQAASAEKPAQ